jgi:hypothetical protein
VTTFENQAVVAKKKERSLAGGDGTAVLQAIWSLSLIGKKGQFLATCKHAGVWMSCQETSE